MIRRLIFLFTLFFATAIVANPLTCTNESSFYLRVVSGGGDPVITTCWAQRGTNYSDFSRITGAKLVYSAIASAEFCPSLSPGGTSAGVVSVLCNFYSPSTASNNNNVEFLIYQGATAEESWITVLKGSGGFFFLEGCHVALTWQRSFVCNIFTA